MARRLSLPIVLGFLIALAVASAASHDLLAQGQASYIFLLSDTSPTRTENGWEPNELLQVVGKEVESTGWVVPLPAGVHVDALTAGRDDGDTLHTILLFTVTPVGGEMHAFAKSDLAREPAVEAASDLFGLAFHSGFDLDRQLSHRKAVDENGDPKPVFVPDQIGDGCVFNFSSTLGLKGRIGRPRIDPAIIDVDDVVAIGYCPWELIQLPPLGGDPRVFFSVDQSFDHLGETITPGDILEWSTFTNQIALFRSHIDLGLEETTNIDALSIKLGGVHPAFPQEGRAEIYFSLDEPSALDLDPDPFNPTFSGADVWAVIETGIPAAGLEGSRFMSAKNLGLERGAEVDGFTTIDPLECGQRPFTPELAANVPERKFQITWQNGGLPETVAIRRNFRQAALLPGHTSTWLDETPDPTLIQVYEISSMIREVVGFPHFGVFLPAMEGQIETVDAEVIREPTDSAHAFVLWETRLTWTLLAGQSPDKVEILRDGIPLAVVDGGTQVYRDREMLPGTYLYELRGIVTGVGAGKAATCWAFIDSETPTIFNTGTLFEPDEPMLISLTFNQETVATVHEIFIDDDVTPAVVTTPLGPALPPALHTVPLPPLPSGGLHRLRVRSFPPGVLPPLPVDVMVSIPFDGFDNDGLDGNDDIPGQTASEVCNVLATRVTINPTPLTTPLEVSCQTVTLHWENHQASGGIEVLRDGSVVATLPDEAIIFTDANAPPGRHLYEVRAQHLTLTDRTSAPAAFEAVVTCGATDLIWSPSYDTGGGETDSAAEIDLALTSLGRTPVVVEQLDSVAPEQLQDVEIVWVSLGTAPHHHVLTPTEADTLAAYLQDGGKLLIEAGAYFSTYLDPLSPLGAALGIRGTPASVVALPFISGLDTCVADLSGLGNVLYDGEPASGVDVLEAAPPGNHSYGEALFASFSGDTIGVIAGNTLSGSVQVGISFEIGGYGTPAERESLVDGLVAALSDPGCDAGPSNLVCTVAGPDVALSWANNAPYFELRVVVDGIVVETLLGSDTSTTVGGLTPGAHSISIVAVLAVPCASGDVCPGEGCEVWIAVGGCALAPVEDLVCFESGGDVLLFWTNGDLYGDVEVLRDGIVIATLTGAPIAYSDVNPGDGLFRYEVRGIAGPECSPAEACDVVVGVVDLIFAHPDQAGGGTDSAAAIEAALSGLGRTPALRPELPDANLLADLSTIWLVLGTFPDKHILTAAEGTALFEASSSLDGVLVVMEGGDTWADDPPTAFHDLTGAVGTGGGSADLGTILGLDSGVGADLSTVTGPGGVPYGGENQSIDHLEPDGSPGAGLIFQNLANGDPVGVYHDAWLSGIGGFQGIATSFEIGGFGSASDQLSLMVELLAIQASSCAGMIYAPVNLVAGLDAAVGEVHLEWSNSGVYDTLEVLRNGAVIHFDPLGADISAVDGSPEVGLNEYVVRATVGPVCFAESAPAEVNVPPPPSGEFVRGDANGSGLIDIADAVFLLAFLFSNGDPPPCDDAADVNDDGMIDISDPVNLLAFLFSNGPPPPPPHPDCGVDPTDDLLDCVEFLPCP